MSIRKLNVAVSGLGRMGSRHALHFLSRVPRANLVAAFSPDEKELAWAEQHLAPYGVTLYSSYDLMLEHTGLEAVVVATVTTVHAEQAIKAIEAGMHVLCEKPLSTSIEISQSVITAAKTRPDLKVLCGFSRRFDVSYRQAHLLTSTNKIGRPTIFRSQTSDKRNESPFFVQYARHSGGIFVDCNIHDVDLALWFFGAGKEGGDGVKVKSISAVGVTAVHPEMKEFGDCDNSVGVVEFWGGRVAYFYGSRMNAPGQHDMTEIIGTDGKLTVNERPQEDLVEVHSRTGISRQIPKDYYGRFSEAFVTEANEWTEACLENKTLPVELGSAVAALKISCALQESLVTGKKIEFDETGNRTEKTKL